MFFSRHFLILLGKIDVKSSPSYIDLNFVMMEDYIIEEAFEPCLSVFFLLAKIAISKPVHSFLD